METPKSHKKRMLKNLILIGEEFMSLHHLLSMMHNVSIFKHLLPTPIMDAL
jgi:hypothetical protein